MAALNGGAACQGPSQESTNCNANACPGMQKIAALCIQWHILVSGFLHFHYDDCTPESDHGLEKRAASSVSGEVKHDGLW